MYPIQQPAQAFYWTVDEGSGRVKRQACFAELFLQSAAQEFQIIGDLAIERLELLDPLHAMHDSRMVAAPKAAANLWQGPARHLFGEIHGDLARAGIVAHALWADHIGQADVVMLGYLPLDLFHSHLAVRGFEHVREAVLRQFKRDFAPNE